METWSFALFLFSRVGEYLNNYGFSLTNNYGFSLTLSEQFNGIMFNSFLLKKSIWFLISKWCRCNGLDFVLIYWVCMDCGSSYHLMRIKQKKDDRTNYFGGFVPVTQMGRSTPLRNKKTMLVLFYDITKGGTTLHGLQWTFFTGLCSATVIRWGSAFTKNFNVPFLP